METQYLDDTTDHTTTNVQEFALYIAELTGAKITGVFLESHDGKLGTVVRNIENANSTLHGTDAAAQPQYNNDIQVDQIIKQSRFSDMFIMEAEVSLDNNHTSMLSYITKAVLTKSECPVLIAPYSFHEIEEIIFAYDASASAVFAIKQFTALFPALNEKKLTVLQVSTHPGQAVKDRKDALALLQKHYTTIGFQMLTGEPGNELFKYLAGKQKAIVVMGAFGSKGLILPYRQSTAEPLVKIINLPIFTAHCA